VTLQQLQTDLESLPGLMLGLAMVFIALLMFGALNRAQIRIRLHQLGWIALSVGTIGLCAWGYLTSLFP
jgi:hypothetical protein